MPRAFSSGALSIWSYAMYEPPFVSAITFVNAAVSVVLPWSTWPIVPTFTCGLLRSNFSFDMTKAPESDCLTDYLLMIPSAIFGGTSMYLANSIVKVARPWLIERTLVA